MKILQRLLLASSLLAAPGCVSWLATRAVADPDAPPRGVRVYAPRHYLLVDAEEKKSQLVTLPDLCRAYDIQPISILSKQDFTVKLDEGQLADLTSNQDGTAWLTFFKSVGELAARSAGVPVSAAQINGSFGLASGVYRIRDDGGLERLGAAKGVGACPGVRASP
jgi:hypothetical protein